MNKYKCSLVNPCLPEDIYELNNTKEYTLLSTNILEHVLTNANLNAQSAKLWQILYNKARFNKNLATNMTYKQLGELINKSTRTIARYVSTLVTHGFLEIQENYENNGNRLENTFYLRIPKDIINNIKNSKDRKRGENNNHTTAPDKSVIISPDKNVTSINNINKYNTNNNNVVVDTKNNSKQGKSRNPETKRFHVEQPAVHENITSPDDNFSKNSMESDEPISVNENALIEKKENLLIKLNKELAILESSLEPNNYLAKFERIREISELKSFVELEKSRLEKCKNEIKKQNKRQESLNKIKQDIYAIANKEGDRAFTVFEFNRLKKGLIGLGISDSKLPELINEIIYTIRFGSLRQQQDSKNLLSIQHAINISLKIVREGRWETPSHFLEI